MKSNATLVLVIVALIVGFGAGFVLRPVLAPAPVTQTAQAAALPLAESAAPRGTQYFTAHIDEARRIVAGCQNGSVRGDECANAGQVVEQADGKARLAKFLGH